jgi:hypothetical protein
MASYGQGYIVTADKPFVIERDKDSAILGPISRSRAYETLSDEEKEYLYWVNKMRVNPSQFYRVYVTAYLNQFPEARSPESETLSTDMRQAVQLPLVIPVTSLNLTASTHAIYLSSIRTLSHVGRGGKDFATRMREAGINTCAGEVIFSGKGDVLVGLILLLIDHRVPGLGHRKALLNPLFTRTGIGIRYANDGKAYLVETFSCD